MKLLRDIAHVSAVIALIGMVGAMFALAGYLFATAPAVLP